eukprot:scaffold28448_cov30-Tisochrysis_lutea.AAC.3
MQPSSTSKNQGDAQKLPSWHVSAGPPNPRPPNVERHGHPIPALQAHLHKTEMPHTRWKPHPLRGQTLAALHCSGSVTRKRHL